MSKEIKKLNKARGAFSRQLTNFEKYITELAEINIEIDHIETLKLRVQKLNENFPNFEEVQTAIEEFVSDENINSEYKKRDEHEDRYFSLNGKAQKYIQEFYKDKNTPLSFTQASDSQHSNTTNQNIKLPTIELPTFSGNFTDWRPFEDTFVALIHKNESLNDVQKLCYLKSSLKGDAAHVIQSLETIESNYVVAWKLLVDRYSHQRRIIYSHINSLLNYKANTLKTYINFWEQQYRSLESLKIPVKQWNAILVPLIFSKLDVKLCRD